MDGLDLAEKMQCARRPVIATPQRRAFAWLRVVLRGSPMSVGRRTPSTGERSITDMTLQCADHGMRSEYVAQIPTMARVCVSLSLSLRINAFGV